MNQFIKFTFAAMLGTLLTFGLLLVLLITITIIAASLPQAAMVHDKSVLRVKLDSTIVDRAPDNPMENFDFGRMRVVKRQGLDDILENLKKAAGDDKIKGICLDPGNIPAGIATIEEIRNAIVKFKKSGKFVISHSDYYTQKAYYLATASDAIYLHPEGVVRFKGLAGQAVFFKKTLRKLEIEPQIIRRGKYKSAVEPFIRDRMSKANKKQVRALLESIWNHMLGQISAARGIEVAELNKIADNLKIDTAQKALDLKLVDALVYNDEFMKEVRRRIGIASDEKINFLSMKKYTAGRRMEKKKPAENKIAVVYASGDIRPGEGEYQSIGSDRMMRAIRKAKKDDSVKAIVLRVNSPGGGVLPSEAIWREFALAKKDKPTVVSMGDMAASGGYYISCPADKIVASPNTITGSIGVYSIVPNMGKLMRNKLGITFDTVKTNKNSDFISSVRPLTPSENKFLENEVEKYYQIFVSHVAEGRKMTVGQVDAVGDGRIWSGIDAKKNGLVDELGGIEKSIEIAAKMAKIKDYETVAYPEPKNAISQFVEAFAEAGKSEMIENELGEAAKYYETVKSMVEIGGAQARLPFSLDIF